MTDWIERMQHVQAARDAAERRDALEQERMDKTRVNARVGGRFGLNPGFHGWISPRKRKNSATEQQVSD
jgi:uncharacterized protein YneR